MKPVPGKQYTIQDENTLSQVARRAYGDGNFWTRIWYANQTRLRSGDPDLIFPGETILIPFLPERQLPPSQLINRDPDSMFLSIDGFEVSPVSGRIIRTINTVANSFTIVIPWEPGLDTELDRRIRPKSYSPVIAGIGSDQIIQGVLYQTKTRTSAKGTSVELTGYTPTVDLVDSTLKPPLEFNGISLEDIVKQVVEPLGFTVKIEADTGGPFDRVTATQNETIFNFLLGLSRQRGVLLSCDVFGNITIIQADVDSSPIATFEEGFTPGVTGYSSAVDGRLMFNTYRAVGQSPFGNQESVSVDNNVPRSRFKTVSANESTTGNIETAADWSRNKTNADALSFPLTVEGWRDPDGNLLTENKIISVVSPSMFIADGFNFLTNSVEHILEGQRTSVVNLVPPSVYTQGQLVEPW
jgi:prophage tail gpP-like protein